MMCLYIHIIYNHNVLEKAEPLFSCRRGKEMSSDKTASFYNIMNIVVMWLPKITGNKIKLAVVEYEVDA